MPSIIHHNHQILKVTRKLIAETAQVSTSTVGMILSGRGQHSNVKTRERVLQVAADLGYQPSINARAFRLKCSLLLGVLVNAVNTHHAAELLRGVQSVIAATDYSPLVFFARSQEDQEQCLARCLDRRVDGLLINCVVGAAAAELDGVIHQLASQAAPVVEFFGHLLPGVPKVNVDNRQTAELCTRHLIAQGHRRIALFTHGRYEHQVLHFDAWEQSQGYRDALQAAGLQPIIIAGDMDFSRLHEPGFLEVEFLRLGAEGLATLLALPQPPTAVLCYTDQTAVGLNRACRLKGLQVPAELSIIGNGGTALSAIINPPLTTTRPPAFEIGRTAAANLLLAIRGQAPADASIAETLIERQSTAAPQGDRQPAQPAR